MKKLYPHLSVGMRKGDVISLFGPPDTTKVNADGSETLGWYSKEFKGLCRGGFLERTISVNLVDNVVVSFEGNNINASAW